ncbi:GNAT family N-acetyltransferase [Oceanospirillum sediminis]|uniref:GNAT family N-acetyltransferase n=1 Tax=Oceanospirillum sediminis TaxID=2760088 RepID=A0A839IUW4_9GAMM|nr:GNAT family N-acetyltransferase [Oceanospirillum sediminis]MBB1488217.1 GNAT family N-acetyltransferase [Oceanospirillum sediminis]
MCSDSSSVISEKEKDFPVIDKPEDSSVSDNRSVVLRADGLSKVYHQYPSPVARLRQIIQPENQYYKAFTALNNVSFELHKGEVLGLVGRNGAGKSTLLQLICGTLTPSSGELHVSGRIAALLELGAGFNPEFTGRENIRLSAALMGLSDRETEQRLEGIIDFSGIRNFIDQPVNTYSSGMYVRLAFSVATSVDPDILVIDEALSVGDGDFARRSFERIMSMKEQGKTILFCSHSLYQLETLCSRAIWLDKGNVIAEGQPDKVVAEYQSYLDRLSLNDSNSGETEAQNQSAVAGQNSSATSDTRLTSVRVLSDGVPGKVLTVKSEHSCLEVDISFVKGISDDLPGVAIAIHSSGGQLVSSCGSWADGVKVEINDAGQGRLRAVFDKIPLLKGRYTLGVLLFCQRGLFLHDEVEPAATLEVVQDGRERGLISLPRYWSQETPVAGVSVNDDPSDSHIKSVSVETVKGTSSRWQVTDATRASQQQKLELFHKAFGQPMSEALWRWKYHSADNDGSVVFESGKLVAFNGAIPRRSLVLGRETLTVQLGDVMVAPEVRGVLTRKGPFYLAAKHFLEQYVGRGKTYAYGFGFPHARSCRLGVKQGLYVDTDRIDQARWPAFSARLLRWRAVDLKPAHLKYIDMLWRQMAADVSDLAIGVRDRQYIEHRYLNKPEQDYLIKLVFRRFALKPCGLLVLKAHRDGSGIELIDFVSSRADAPSVIRVAQVLTAQMGQQWLFAWTTPSVQAWLDETSPVIEPTEVVIPGNAVNDKEYALEVKDRWWLTGGDTDFR